MVVFPEKLKPQASLTMPGSLNNKIEENILSSGGCKSAGAGQLAMKEHREAEALALATDEHGISRKKTEAETRKKQKNYWFRAGSVSDG